MVGRNGAGKTSTLRCLAGIVPLDSGRAECGGRVVSLLELGAGFGPDFTGRENIYLNGALHGFAREEIEERIDRIVEFSELGEFIDVPVKAYSSGMFLRLGFSIVAHLDADVMLIDEILAVGDESFQRKCLDRISERMEPGATLVLVSHDPTAIERVCDRVVVVDDGARRSTGRSPRVCSSTTGCSAPRRARRSRCARRPRARWRSPSSSSRTPTGAAGTCSARASRCASRARCATGRRSAPCWRSRCATSAASWCFRTDRALGVVDGRLEASFDIERLALLGGDYDLAVGALDQDAPQGRLLDRVARFSVASVPTARGSPTCAATWRVAVEA